MREEIPAVGTMLGGQYRLTEIVGEGGMGIIYRARQESIGRDVAVKVLRTRYMKDEMIVSRFENEAKIISQLRHPNTLRLYDTQTTSDGRLFIVTEYLQGQSLEESLRGGALPVDRVVHIADQIAASLSEAHEMGIVHRDLKPANIFLDHVGGEDHVKVLDFGIAKLIQGSGVKTQANIILGTPGYMSPEQVKGALADSRSDIYALGVLIYQMLSGNPPFHATNPVQLLVMQVEDPPPPLSPELQLPEPLAALVFEMLSKEPADRPQNVTEVRERLRAIARTFGGESNPSLSFSTRSFTPAPMRRAAPRAASQETMPFESLDQLPTAAWDRPETGPAKVASATKLTAPHATGSRARTPEELGLQVSKPGSVSEATLSHLDKSAQSIHSLAPAFDKSPPHTITVPIEFEEPIELEQSVGLEMFLDEAMPEARERTRVDPHARSNVRGWVLIGVGMVTAAVVAYMSLSRVDEDQTTEAIEVQAPLVPVPEAVVTPVPKAAAVEDRKPVARPRETTGAARPQRDDALERAAAKIQAMEAEAEAKPVAAEPDAELGAREAAPTVAPEAATETSTTS